MKQMRIPNKINPKILLILGVFGVSFSSIFIKHSQAPSLVLATYRLTWTVVILLPIVLLRFQNEWKQLQKKDYLLCGISGVLLAFHFAVWFESLKYTSIASSTLLVCTEVVFTAIGFVLFMKGHIQKIGILAITITMLGSLLIALNDRHTGINVLYGDSLALLGAIFVAAYTLIGRVQRNHLSTTMYSFLTYFSCMITLLILAYLTGTPLTGYGINEIWIGLFLGISCTLLGHSIFSWSLKYISPSFVSATKLLEPIFASLLAILIYSELPTIQQIIGGLIVISGVLLYSYIEK